jgi:hypothetical protein
MEIDKFNKKYQEYKKNFLIDIDNNVKKKIKEEIYNLIHDSIKYIDINSLILNARKDAIDYNKINYNTLYEKLSIYNNRMLEINEQIIKIQKIVIITKDNIMSLSNKYINFISLYVNRENIKKINKLFENENIDDNYYLINRINNIDITKMKYNTYINNGYSIEMIEKLANKKIIRIYFLLLNNITQYQQEIKINQLIDEYFLNFTNYNIIRDKIKKLDMNHNIAQEGIRSIIIKNIIIISKYLLQDEIITETFLLNEKFLFEIQYKLINKKYIFSLLENYDIIRLKIFKNYLVNNLLLLL